ncbi:hypothetical protein AB5J62_20415 [Amycolatopsis sp. cg5]|uniref:hypothetical protein n=1 Tax=Amycolatopsis sp. cg5 TaxID=3238802 RepID=UPI003526A4FE
MNVTRKAMVAAGGAAVAAATVFAAVSTAAGPTPAPLTQAAEGSCTTDAAGVCDVSHLLGAVPVAVVVTPVIGAGDEAYSLSVVRGSYTQTAFEVRAMTGKRAPYAHREIVFSYAAYANAPTPPTSSKTTPVTTSSKPTSPTPSMPSSSAPNPSSPPATTKVDPPSSSGVPGFP